jgi:hypothetical protein
MPEEQHRPLLASEHVQPRDLLCMSHSVYYMLFVEYSSRKFLCQKRGILLIFLMFCGNRISGYWQQYAQEMERLLL